MPYELFVNAGVAGQEKIAALAGEAEKLTDTTRRLNPQLGDFSERVKTLVSSGSTLAEALKKVSAEQAGLATATTSSTQALSAQVKVTQQLTAAHQQSVSQIQAVGGALRVMEGAMPIRAAERFLTLIPGIGSALQVAFPIFGAVAFAEVMGRMVSKAGELYNSWNPIVQAQKESLKLLEDSDRKYESLIQKSNALRLDQFEREHGRSARLRLEATEASGDASYEDAARIRTIQEQIAKQQAVLNAPTSGVWLNKGMVTPAQQIAAREKMVGLSAQLEEAQLQQKVDNQRASDLKAKANESDTKKGDSEAAKEQREHDRIERAARQAALHADVEEWKSIQKMKEKAAHEMATIFDHTMPSLHDGGAERELDAQLKTLAAGRDPLGGILGPIGAPAPVGPSGQEQLRTAQQQGRRNLAIYGVRSQLAGASPAENIQGELQLKLSIAQQEYQAQLRIADAKHDQQMKEDALDQLVQKRYDATLDAEQKILELQLRQKQEFEGMVTGLIGSAIHGGGAGAGNFIKGQVTGVAEHIAGNVAGMAWQGISKIIPHAAAGTTLGKVLSGTVFGPDATKAATQANTLATNANTQATLGLTRAMAMSRSGGGGGSIPGIGGGGSGDAEFDPGSWGSALPTDTMGENGDTGGETNNPVDAGTVTGSSDASASGGGGASSLGRIGGGLAGAFGVYHGITDIARGGARNDVAGAGQIAAGAGAIISAIAPALAAAGPIGMIAGLGLSLVSSLLGDPKAAQQQHISTLLQHSQFMAPVAINGTMTTGGTHADFDRFGDVRGSNLSPFPTVQQGFFDYRHNQVIPGRTVSTFGGPGGPPAQPVQVTIHALDSKSITDRHADIADAVARSLNLGSSTHLAETLSGRGA